MQQRKSAPCPQVTQCSSPAQAELLVSGHSTATFQTTTINVHRTGAVNYCLHMKDISLYPYISPHISQFNLGPTYHTVATIRATHLEDLSFCPLPQKPNMRQFLADVIIFTHTPILHKHHFYSFLIHCSFTC